MTLSRQQFAEKSHLLLLNLRCHTNFFERSCHTGPIPPKSILNQPFFFKIYLLNQVAEILV